LLWSKLPRLALLVEAAVVLGEVAGAVVVSGPPDMLSALAPAAAEAVDVLTVERPVAADAEMAEASLLGTSEEGGRGTATHPVERQPCPRAAEFRGAAPVASVPDPWGLGSPLRS
jgi:hypothetical protein